MNTVQAQTWPASPACLFLASGVPGGLPASLDQLEVGKDWRWTWQGGEGLPFQGPGAFSTYNKAVFLGIQALVDFKFTQWVLQESLGY